MTSIVRTRAYESGSRYYTHPDWFLYLLADLCALQEKNGPSKSRADLSELKTLLKLRLAEREGSSRWCDAWSAALRMAAGQALGMANNWRDLEILVRAQQVDGSWGLDSWVFRFGHGIKVGNTGMVTAMAVKALKGAGPKAVGDAKKRI